MYAVPVTLSVVIITHNEEVNIGRTLESVKPIADEIIVVDSGSTDRTRELAASHGAKVFVEQWKGYAAQKNSAIEKATCDWVLSLDADEEVNAELAQALGPAMSAATPQGNEWCLTNKNPVPQSLRSRLTPERNGYHVARQNLFLGRWIRHGGFYPDRKLRLFRRGAGRFIDRPVHETVQVDGPTGTMQGALIHHAYPTLTGYIEQMNKYSSLGAEVALSKGQTGRNPLLFAFNVVYRPYFQFLYNYILRLGFLDGREGLLLNLYHAVYVSWKYAKAWEQARRSQSATPVR